MDMNNSHPKLGEEALSNEEKSYFGNDYNTRFYIGLISAALKDAAITCNQTDTELARDILEIEQRTSCEGLPFLTRTLPSLGKSLDQALASNTVLEFTGFKACIRSKWPRFMRSYFKLVFDVDGRERDDACPKAIRCIRQVLYLFYKLNLPPTEEQKNEVIQMFISTDQSLSFDAKKATPFEKWVISNSRTLICRVLGGVDPLDDEEFNPRHGPGAVATGEKANEKPIFRRYYRALARVFPYDRYFFYNLTHLCDELGQLEAMEEIEAGTAKVVLVPKDSRGPRLISCEPLEYQWIQQGLMRLMVKTIESHPLTRGYVNFTDQTVNRTLALAASLSGTQVTLDMKEASDRVSLELVKALFPATWYDALLASRSPSTELPDGTVLALKKFAPMGSAVCFPVEALVFWALTVSCISYYQDSRAGRKAARQSVFVYGDDIILRTEDLGHVINKLTMFDLVFNMGKCCTGRFFRESCGCDAYKGVDVTPLKVRAVWSSSLLGMDYVSWVAYHNAFNERGSFNACDYLSGHIQSIRLTPYAESEGSAVVALVDCRKTAIHANSELGIRTRFHCSSDPSLPSYQYKEVKAWVVRARILEDTSVPGWSELQRVASYKTQHSRRIGSHPSITTGSGEWLLNHSRLAPTNPLTPSEAMRIALECDGSLVTAYQYTLPRQVTLRRGWGRLNDRPE